MAMLPQRPMLIQMELQQAQKKYLGIELCLLIIALFLAIGEMD
jgi:hypothetical protein